MLDAHPQLAIPPETHFAPRVIRRCRKGCTPAEVVDVLVAERRWGDFGIDPEEVLERLAGADRVAPRRALRAFYGIYAGHVGKPRWGDKTPPYAKHIELIGGVLPEAHFIHLIRDGRDTALSRADRAGRRIHFDAAAARWRRWIHAAREQGESVGRYMELRYEDLVADPEPELRRICEFTELDWDPVMLRHHEHAGERLEELDRELPADDRRSRTEGAERMRIHARAREPASTERIARWRKEMSPDDLSAFEAVAGDLLADLGYERSV
jgi:Sulfotransferase family